MTTWSDLATEMLAETGPAAVVCRQWLMPAEGREAVIFPPTFAAGEGGKVGYSISPLGDSNVAILDTVGSQANRMEPLFKANGADTPYSRYLPLPTIPRNGRDGRIRRVLIAEPFAGGGGRAQAVARRLAGAALSAESKVEGGGSRPMADLRAISNAEADKLLRTRYLQEARVWGSVTPLVLPGRDDRSARKAHGLVLKALAQAGYTTPVTEVDLQPDPVFPGAEPARAYRAPAYLRDFPRTHALIVFAEPVGGAARPGRRPPRRSWCLRGNAVVGGKDIVAIRVSL